MSAPDVIVIDYGVGNLLSVQRGLEFCGAKVLLTSDPEKILAAKRVVLPGVGAFKNAMQALKNLELVEVICKIARNNTPLLGICLGMQLLLDESEEFGVTRGLGLIPGRVIPVPRVDQEGLDQKIPHIGWEELYPAARGAEWGLNLLADTRRGDSVYFVHSFMADSNEPKHRIADCSYGGHNIAAVIAKDNIMGCQFHPEKSGEVGLRILHRFLMQ
ncbi:imidazole glycerol phosphate synthase subunit HisH [Polynucleobacter sp. AM-25C3]|uniref:imidazole glycerol phosphate synthase subunit HisH n=1 Tax=Polynucleobacter sp. AM-25C3 TaxID=1855569 RepID=UPI001C0B2BDC|nr:imidazole glycerol phosphate synthase subunit HisH [Polynucleobacter sp. AM-25C3]MBU3601778.1 imidazole glycerol phosphate synthase subunit HisH [Polynucleobacter sp. AM-25C3]